MSREHHAVICVFKVNKVRQVKGWCPEKAQLAHLEDSCAGSGPSAKESWLLAVSSHAVRFCPAVAPVILLESHCAAARDTVQCLCVVKSNPEPSVAFELPSRNVTVNETEREFVYSERSGLLLTSILTLRGQAQAPPRIICTSRNLYGTKSLELPFQGARECRGLGLGATGERALLSDPGFSPQG